MAEASALSLVDCSFGYGASLVLDAVSLDVMRAEVVVLAGPNGAGKTTLLRLLTGIHRPASGRVRVDGLDPATATARILARHVAVVPQDASFQFPYNVSEVVRMGRTAHLGCWGFEAAADTAAVEQALALCDLAGLAHRPIHQLSGGERQRVIIARALAQEAPLLLLDEPTRSLDPRHTQEILRIVRRIRQEQGRTVVMVTHDLNAVSGLADRLVLMRGGRIIHQGGPADALTTATLLEVYGIEMEVLTARNGRRVVVAGS